jgi:hypothetical protein
MMHASSSQMSDPPQGQEQHQQQPINPCPRCEDRPFNISAWAFAVFKGGFHPHPQAILAGPLASRQMIGQEDPGIALVRLPDRTGSGSQVVFLPDERWTKPLLPALADQVGQCAPTPGLPPTLSSGGMVAGEAQQRMPLACLAQVDEWESGQPTIRQEGTLSRAQVRNHAVQHGSDNGPLPLLPGFLQRHHRPTHRQQP